MLTTTDKKTTRTAWEYIGQDEETGQPLYRCLVTGPGMKASITRVGDFTDQHRQALMKATAEFYKLNHNL